MLVDKKVTLRGLDPRRGRQSRQLGDISPSCFVLILKLQLLPIHNTFIFYKSRADDYILLERGDTCFPIPEYVWDEVFAPYAMGTLRFARCTISASG